MSAASKPTTASSFHGRSDNIGRSITGRATKCMKRFVFCSGYRSSPLALVVLSVRMIGRMEMDSWLAGSFGAGLSFVLQFETALPRERAVAPSHSTV